MQSYLIPFPCGQNYKQISKADFGGEGVLLGFDKTSVKFHTLFKRVFEKLFANFVVLKLRIVRKPCFDMSHYKFLQKT